MLVCCVSVVTSVYMFTSTSASMYISVCVCACVYMSVCVAVIDNSRYDSLQFDVALDTVLHGFGGYFYCVLYADISFSTLHRRVAFLLSRLFSAVVSYCITDV